MATATIPSRPTSPGSPDGSRLASQPRAVSGRLIGGVWILTGAVPVVGQIVAANRFEAPLRLDLPAARLLVTVVAATVCLLAAASLVARAFRTNEAELGFVGSFFAGASTMLLVHGITTPDMLVDQNGAHSLSLLLAVPVGALAASPFFFRRGAGGIGVTPGSGRGLREHWRSLVAAAFLAVTILMLVLVVGSQIVPSATPQHLLVAAVGVESMLACLVMSRRNLRLAQAAGRLSPLVVSLAFGLVAASSGMWLSVASFDDGASLAGALLVAGVLVGAAGAHLAHRRTETLELLIGPVLSTEPLTALEVGLDPVVRRFCDRVDDETNAVDDATNAVVGGKTETRDHVIRTRELALRVGTEMRLASPALRDLGLAAILHDVGKAGVPDSIVNKADRLTPGEFEIMQSHVEIGERLVAASPAISSAAPAIRSHHERMDGHGYPDGLVGQDIPQNARILAVCDAYDAMANSRRYRAGMGHDRAVSILREHAGSQWDPVVVEALVIALARGPLLGDVSTSIDTVGRESDVGRGAEASSFSGCDCLPESVLELLEAEHDASTSA